MGSAARQIALWGALAAALPLAAAGASQAAPRPDAERGALTLDGKPRYLWSGDYPYYRDDPASWERRLLQMRAAGIRFVSFYIPWRHHAPEDPRGGGGYDFTGRTDPARDVVGFIRLIRKHGMLAIAKPGPFIHAELQYGGLPDYVNPLQNPAIEGEANGIGAPFFWVPDPETNGLLGWLPAPGDPVYEGYVRDWMRAVAEAIGPLAAPAGPIVALQVANEGIYSDSSVGWVNAYDYSGAGASAFRAWLAERYGPIAAYNEAHASAHSSYESVEPPRTLAAGSSPQAMLGYLDWSEYQGHWLGRTVARWAGYLRDGSPLARLPVFYNFNFNAFTYGAPGNDDRTNDGLLSRLNPPAYAPHGFGHTNWVGVLPRDERTYEQYVLGATIDRGPNMEEDWGFSDIYDPAYEFTQPSLFQSLLFTAAGATGVNVYTAVGTDHWRRDPNLDDGRIPAHRVVERTGKPYPASAPIAPDGSTPPKYYTLQRLGRLWSAIGSGLAGGRPAPGLGFAVYRPYAFAGAWTSSPGGDAGAWTSSGLPEAPSVALGGIDGAIASALASDVPFGQVDLASAPLSELRRFPLLAIRTFDYMGLAEQRKLRDYAEGGGTLLVTGAIPTRDERLAPARGALAELFPHTAELVAGGEPRAVAIEARGRTRDAAARAFRRLSSLPHDAAVVARVGDDVAGYVRPAGLGRAIYLGFSSWADDEPPPSGDPELAAANSGLAELLGFALGRLRRQGWTDSPDVADVFVSIDGRRRSRRHVTVLTRATAPREYLVRFRDRRRRVGRLRLSLPAGGVAHLVLDDGRLVAAYVRGRDDLTEKGDVAPRVRGWALGAPGDLLVIGGGLRRSALVAVGGEGGQTVRVPFRARRVSVVTQPHDPSGRPRESRIVRVPFATRGRVTTFTAAPETEVRHYRVTPARRRR